MFKARIAPPFQAYASTDNEESSETEVDRVKHQVKANEERDNVFLNSKKDADDLETGEAGSGWAHAPYWPDVSYTLTPQILRADGYSF